MQLWLTWIFIIVIIFGILAWIGLSIYQKICSIPHTFWRLQEKKKNNKIYNLKYKNIIKNDTYINKNSKINTLKNSLNKTL